MNSLIRVALLGYPDRIIQQILLYLISLRRFMLGGGIIPVGLNSLRGLLVVSINSLGGLELGGVRLILRYRSRGNAASCKEFRSLLLIYHRFNRILFLSSLMNRQILAHPMDRIFIIITLIIYL